MYKLQLSYFTNEPCAVQRDNDNGSFTSIPFDPANTDYQQYLKWLEAGNTPLPAEEQQ